MKAIIKSMLGLMLLGCAGMTVSCNEDFAEAPSTRPFPEIGTGTWENPLQTWQAHLGTMPEGRESNWVTGYIVGYVNSDVTNSMSAAVLGDGATVAVKNNNIILAQIPYDETTWKTMGYTLENNCVPVQLPSGASRSACNLQDHPENFNRQVSLRGVTGSKYMGAYGLRSAYEYNWGPKGRFEEPIKELGGEYFCNFSASHDINYYVERGWSLFMQKGGMTGFTVNEYNGQSAVGMSAYYGSLNGGPYINWIVSPELDLDLAEKKILSFRSQVRYSAPGTTLSVFVMTHKNPLAGTITELECPISTTDNSWVSSGDINLEQFSGKVYIGFRYYSEKGGDGNSATYNMTDFNFGGADPEEWIYVDPSSIGTYRKASGLESGKRYAMVFENKYVCLPAPESSNYGRLNVAEVEFTSEAKTEFSASKNDAFTFTNVEGDYWQIKDYAGRLIYMDDDQTHGTFQFGSQKDYSDKECSWRITERDGHYEMVSYFRDYHLEYNPTFSNVSPNSGNYVSGNCAELYELIEEAGE